MSGEFKNLYNEEALNKEAHHKLWDKYLDHIYSSEFTIQNVAHLTSIHTFQVSILNHRREELSESLVLLIELCFIKRKINSPELKDYLLRKVKKSQFRYVITQLTGSDIKSFTSAENATELNQFINFVLIRRETYTYIDSEEILGYTNLGDLSTIVLNLNLYVQTKLHLNTINVLLDRYFTNSLSPEIKWISLKDASKEKIEGKKAGRKPTEVLSQDNVDVYIREFKESGDFKKVKYWRVTDGPLNGSIIIEEVAQLILSKIPDESIGQDQIKTIKNRINSSSILKKYLPKTVSTNYYKKRKK